MTMVDVSRQERVAAAKELGAMASAEVWDDTRPDYNGSEEVIVQIGGSRLYGASSLGDTSPARIIRRLMTKPLEQSCRLRNLS